MKNEKPSFLGVVGKSYKLIFIPKNYNNIMKKFIRDTLVSAIGSLLGFGLLSLIGFITFIGLLIVIFSGEEIVEIEDKSVLVFDLSTSIRDQEYNGSLEDALIGNLPNTLSLLKVTDAIENAATDNRISAIFLQGDGFGNPNGFATLKEVRNSLVKFRESGKPIIAYDVDLSEGEYYISSVADKLILNPLGTLEINGLAFPQMFLTGAFEKYGIGMQIIRVGSFKGAVEPFTRKNFSPENRQQTQELLNDLWGDFTKTISNTRNIQQQKIQQLVQNKGVISPQEAFNNKFIDKIGYFDEALDELIALTNTPDGDYDYIPQISLDEYIDINDTGIEFDESENQIAIVYAEGEIVNGKGDVNTIGGDSLAKTLRKLRQDNEVEAVVFRINSPGGSATASDIIWREVALLQEKVPVIVSMGDIAASGGYWIATGGNYIFAEETTITGSIGVFGILPNIQKLGSNNGITWDIVKTGTFADITTVSRPKTEAELKIYQTMVNQIYQLFLQKVATSRNLTTDKVNQIAQGRVWSGIDAKNNGLVDQIGGLDAAINYAAQEANLGDDFSLREYPIPKTLEEEILEELFGTQTQKQIDPLTQEFLNIRKDLALLQSLNDPKGVYARLPYTFRLE